MKYNPTQGTLIEYLLSSNTLVDNVTVLKKGAGINLKRPHGGHSETFSPLASTFRIQIQIPHPPGTPNLPGKLS